MRCITLFTLFFLSVYTLRAQNSFSDSLNISVGTQVQAASKGFQPLWAKANRFGLASNEQYDQITWAEATNTHRLGGMRLFSNTASTVLLSYGATVFNSKHYRRTVLQQAFAQLKYKEWFIRGGRHKDLWDDLDPELSMGSLGTSGNALPIPKITIGIDDYINIPWTKGVLQFKGMMGHGWLGDNRFMESFLHEKSFYGRINLNKWKIYGGIQHYAEWGGKRSTENIYLDRSFKGFLDVVFVLESNDGSFPIEDEEAGRRANKAGDHRGLAELGAYFEDDQILIQVYNQTPFESGKGIDIRNLDRLLGVHIKTKKQDHFLRDIVAEFIYTKQMENFGGREMQSYYNNGPMVTGWEYERLVVGTPLFTNREEASGYLPVTPYDWRGRDRIPGNNNIINNRLIGGNVAAKLRIKTDWDMLAKITPVMNYGARNYEQYYGNGDGLFQFYSTLGVFYKNGPWTWNARINGDFGDLYGNFGGNIGLSYQVH